MSRVFEIINSKRAVRQFRDTPLPDVMIRQILDAGRLSGSAKNMQPWHFIAVADRQTLVQLAACGEFAGHLAGAALGVALATPDPYLRLTVPFDLGRASQNMMLTAWAAGIGSVMATIYRPQVACGLLGVPQEFTIPWCISFGYSLEEHARPPRKGGRRSAADVIHFDRW